MRNYKTRAFIACKRTNFRFSCDSRMNVSLQELPLLTRPCTFVDCSLKMDDCSFVEESDPSLSLSFALNSTADIHLNGCSFQSNSESSLKISGNSVRLNISNFFFANNTLHDVNDTLFAMSTKDLHEFVIDRRSYTHNLSSCEIKA